MKKVEMVEKIAAMMNLGTVEAKKVIINAVSEWGLQKSENFYDLLVVGEYDKAASRATVAELKEMEEFIAFYKADEPAQEERTVFFSAQEAHNYQAEKARKANDNQVKAHKVGIQLQMDAINETACSIEEELPSGKQPNKHDIAKEIVQLRHTKEIDRSRFRTIVMKSLFKFRELSWSVKTNLFCDLYTGGSRVNLVAKRTKKQYLEAILSALQTIEFNAPTEPSEVETIEVDPVVDSIVNETRRGFLVLFKEWVITNSSYILKNLHDLDSGMLAVMNISRGDWSVDEYSIRHLGKIYIEAQNELTALQGGAN